MEYNQEIEARELFKELKDLSCCRIAMELYEGVSRRMGLPEVMIRGSMEYMAKSRIFVVTFLGMLDPVGRTISTPQVMD